MSAIRGVLFDLDGTLVDHESAAADAVVAALADMDGAEGVEPAALGRLWVEIEHAAMDRYLAGEIGFQEQRRLRVARLRAELGLPAWTDEQADEWFTGYLREYERAWRTYPDALPALERLRRERPEAALGVVTNGNGQQQRRKLAQTGLAALMPTVVVSGEVGVAKPDPEIFQIACRRLGLPPQEVAYVGDRHQTDALAAKAAGLRGIWLDRGGEKGADPGVPVIASLADLPGVLARWRL